MSQQSEVICRIDDVEALLTIPEAAGHLACIAVSEALAYLRGWREQLEAQEVAEALTPARGAR